MKKINKPTHFFIFPLVPKNCPICERANPLSAKCCAYCGSSFVSPECDNRDNHPSMRQNPKTLPLYTMGKQTLARFIVSFYFFYGFGRKGLIQISVFHV